MKAANKTLHCDPNVKKSSQGIRGASTFKELWWETSSTMGYSPDIEALKRQHDSFNESLKNITPKAKALMARVKANEARQKELSKEKARERKCKNVESFATHVHLYRKEKKRMESSP